MSIPLIRKALEDALAAMPGALPFARQNKPYKSVIDVPYAQLWLVPGKPDGAILGDGFKRETGFLQINLSYPEAKGTEAAELMADAICKRFKRGTTFDAGFRVLVNTHPYIGPATGDTGWLRLPVRVPYVADVFGDV